MAEANIKIKPEISWADELILMYESGAASQFLLHGNVNDRLLFSSLYSSSQVMGLGGLSDFLIKVLLMNFDVVLTFDLGNGVRIEKGQELVGEWSRIQKIESFSRSPLQAMSELTTYFRYAANLRRINISVRQRIACIVRDAHLLAPAGQYSAHYELNALVSLLRDWGSEALLAEYELATFLITENLNDLHQILVNNPRAARIRVELPSAKCLESALTLLLPLYPCALENYKDKLSELAYALRGASLWAVECLLKTKEHSKKAIESSDLSELKKSLVENDCQGLIEFIESKRTLDSISGQEKIKTWVRQDVILWQKNDLEALPKGYLLCGPVGTGKTFFVECIAGEAGIPVVKLRNFRDRWVGSSESNLERIFRLLHALGRCIVFIDEADQALGKRDSGAGDSNVSGRIYSMIAEEMGNPDNRGRILWVLASSRPDLIEVDLKRPGRIDVKIPLFPTITKEESFCLISALCKRRQLSFPDDTLSQLEDRMPLLLTPGAAEALSVKVYRKVKTENLSALDALKYCLSEYQPPVALEILESQIQIALSEASDKEFVPEFYRGKKL